MEIVSIMQSCIINFNALLEEFVILAQKRYLFWQEFLVFCHFQIDSIMFVLQNASVTLHDNVQVICISGDVYTNYSSPITICQVWARNSRCGFSHLNLF